MTATATPSTTPGAAASASTPTNFDCEGVSGGSALPGTPCDDGNASTGNDVYQSDCSCGKATVVIDCTGVVGDRFARHQLR
ncbi:MAG: hypothetical protein R2818_09975 [Flavobacteriales bacterium]